MSQIEDLVVFCENPLVQEHGIANLISTQQAFKELVADPDAATKVGRWYRLFYAKIMSEEGASNAEWRFAQQGISKLVETRYNDYELPKTADPTEKLNHALAYLMDRD